MKEKIIQIFLLIVFSLFIFISQKNVIAEQPIQIDFFYSTTCPHCDKTKAFLELLKKDYPQLILNQYEISQYSQLLIDFYKKYQVPIQSQGLVPIVFINDKYFIGFDDKISRQIKECIIDSFQKTGSPAQDKCPANNKIIIPFIGEIDPAQFALPILAIILGVMDGFNVCSLGALLLILALVLALKSRVKTLIYGGAFILTTGVIYGLLIYFWYQLFHILTPHLRQMQMVIGLVTIGGGVYFLKEFFKFRREGPVCEIGPAQKLEGKFSKKFQSLLDNKAKALTILISILIFAAVITIVEFPCSAAVPVVFAGILNKAQLPNLAYLFYIILYVIFYMLDELLVFLAAFFSMKLWLASPKFITWITLLQSIILFLLGGYYLL